MGWSGLQKTLDNVRQQLILYEESFSFFFCFSLVGTFFAPAVLRTAHSDLHLPTSQLFCCFVTTGCFYTQERRPFPSAWFVFFGNSWILQRAESELSTLKRTISACELYTVLTPCLYSLDLFVRGKRRHFRKRDICATSNHVYVFLCFMGFFNF